jgi:hypothetical protein
VGKAFCSSKPGRCGTKTDVASADSEPSQFGHLPNAFPQCDLSEKSNAADGGNSTVFCSKSVAPNNYDNQSLSGLYSCIGDGQGLEPGSLFSGTCDAEGNQMTVGGQETEKEGSAKSRCE